MARQRRWPPLSLTIFGVIALFVAVLAQRLLWRSPRVSGEQFQENPPETAIETLVTLSPEERDEELAILARSSPQVDRIRAKYLLARDLLTREQPQAALEQLQDLERSYPALEGHILLDRARAYAKAGNEDKSQQILEDLLDRHGDRPVAAEALHILGFTDRALWDRLLAEFPRHPRSAEVAVQRLQENSKDAPENIDLLLLLSRHLYLPNYLTYLDRLKNDYGDRLTPEQWELVAFGYWEKQIYGEAGKAYAKAPPTARNLYRSGRGLQLGDETKEARSAYRQLAEQFPEAPETGEGLVKLAAIVREDEEAIPILDRAIANFPDRAAEALLLRAKTLDRLDSADSAKQARESILTQYSNSDTAAELRWQYARDRAEEGDFAEAWQWAQQITTENPNSEEAPKAAFWVGKWAARLGREAEAKQAFEFAIGNYPESYYAWRSAVQLGWEVGDFNTLRSRSPQVVIPTNRHALPSGSQTLQELYWLGLDREAWTIWQVEFENAMQPTADEQFTDGIMRVGVGDYLEGLFMLSNLKWRDEPEVRSRYLELKQTPAYWQGLYPFPYLEPILKWSQERQLNPMLTISLIRQESRFMRSIQSSVGATGLMQVMPDTAEWISEQRGEDDLDYDLTNPEDNIRLGTLYLDYTHDEYDDNSLLAMASYNAGPGSVASWLDRFSTRDPDEFAAKIPFPETNHYIEAVFGNYWNYLRLYEPNIRRQVDSLANG